MPLYAEAYQDLEQNTNMYSHMYTVIYSLWA